MKTTEEQKQQMAENLNTAFCLLKTVMDLKLAYLQKMYPDKTEAELTQKILLDIIATKERQWKSPKI